MTAGTFTTWQGSRYPVSLAVRPGTSDEKAAREVIDRNAYQRPRLGFTIEPGDAWLDCGANIGAFSALALHLGARVFAIEPVEDHFAMLALNVAPWADRAVIIPAAVTPPGVTDNQTVYVRPDAVAWRSSTLPQKDATHTETAMAFPIDAAIFAFDVDCVKLDIEGGELDIFDAWHPDDRIRKLAFEWSFDVDPDTARLRRVLAELEADGFTTSTHTHVYTKQTWEAWPYGVPCFAWR